MTNEEIDMILTLKVQRCAAGKNLPSGFSDRLVRSVHARRRLRRLKLLATIIVLAVVSAGIFGVFSPRKPRLSNEATLIATNESPAKDSQLTGWMLFGAIRECFKRNRTTKKKEEEL